MDHIISEEEIIHVFSTLNFKCNQNFMQWYKCCLLNMQLTAGPTQYLCTSDTMYNQITLNLCLHGEGLLILHEFSEDAEPTAPNAYIESQTVATAY